MRNNNGTFAPGWQGKPKGAQNKTTKERKGKLEKLVKAIEKDHLEDDLQALSPRDRIKVYLMCHEYLIPKLQRTEVHEITEVEELLSLTPEERQAKIVEIKQKLQKYGS